MKVYYDSMKEIDEQRDLEAFRKHQMYFEALTKFIRGLQEIKDIPDLYIDEEGRVYEERLPAKVLFVQKNF